MRMVKLMLKFIKGAHRHTYKRAKKHTFMKHKTGNLKVHTKVCT